MSVLVSNIQKMSISDGPGLRTTVFLMGCSLHCPWCANPENLRRERRLYFNEDKCIKKSTGCPFSEMCKTDDLKIFFEKSSTEVACPIKATGVYGKEYEAEELISEILSDRTYWQNDGGVTFSGGEALLWAKELSPVLKALKREGISVTLETSLFAPLEYVRSFAEYCDLFYVDVKVLDSDMCLNALGGQISNYFENLDYLLSINTEIIFRVPCNDRYTLSERNMPLLLDFFEKHSEIPIEIFKVHSIGDAKYRSLGMIPPGKLDCNNFITFKEKLLDRELEVRELNI